MPHLSGHGDGLGFQRWRLEGEGRDRGFWNMLEYWVAHTTGGFDGGFVAHAAAASCKDGKDVESGTSTEHRLIVVGQVGLGRNPTGS